MPQPLLNTFIREECKHYILCHYCDEEIEDEDATPGELAHLYQRALGEGWTVVGAHPSCPNCTKGEQDK